jgi:peptide/nickel transport system substrate-binding protein
MTRHTGSRSTRSTRYVAAGAALTLAGCALAACGDEANSEGKYVDGGTFTMALPADIGSFDPYRNPRLVSYAAIAYDSLVNLAPDGRIVSGLAETWQADEKGATFTLRSDVTCSDGAKLTPTQVAAALDFVKDPKNGSPLFGTLVPPTPFTVTADDAAGTVELAMQRPYGFLLQTIGLVPIVCEAGMADPDALAKKSVGTGPFVLSEVQAGTQYTFTVRKGYAWGPDGATTDEPGTPSTLVAKVIPDQGTAANLLLSGEVNAAGVTGPNQDRLVQQDLAHIDIPMVVGELWFNQKDGRPGADATVRRALATGLDLDDIIKVATGGRGEQATAMVTAPSRPCRDDTTDGQLPEFDVEGAGRLLDQAGWQRSGAQRAKDGKPLTVKLRYSSIQGEQGTAAVELVKQGWEKLGVRVELVSDDPNAVNRAMFQTGDFDAYWSGFAFSLPSQVVPFVSGPTPPRGQNFAGIQNEKYDELVARAAELPAPEACPLWSDAERSLVREADVLPIAQQPVSTFLSGAEGKTNSFQLIMPTSIRVVR